MTSEGRGARRVKRTVSHCVVLCGDMAFDRVICHRDSQRLFLDRHTDLCRFWRRLPGYNDARELFVLDQEED